MKNVLAALLFWLFSSTMVCAQSKLEESFRYAQALNDSARYLEAINAFRQVQKMAKASGGMHLYTLSLMAEGECYYALDLRDEIQKVIRRADSLSIDDAEWKYEFHQNLLKLKGSYYYCSMDYDGAAFSKAEASYTQSLVYLDSLKTSSQSFDDTKRLAYTLYREMLSLYYKHKDYETALAYADKVCEYCDDGDLGIERIEDAHSSRAMVLARLRRFSEALSEFEYCGNSPTILRRKGKVILLQNHFGRSGDMALARQCYKAYVDAKQKEIVESLASMTERQRQEYWLTFHDFLYDCACLEGYDTELLYDVLLYSKDYLIRYDTASDSKISWREVRNMLKPGECAIEFLQYKDCDEANRLVALVVKPSSKKPNYIPLCNVDTLLHHKVYRNFSVRTALTTARSLKDNLYTDSVLFDNIWTKELMAAIGESRNVYFASDGIVHQMAIEYMIPDTSIVVHRLSSTRVLLQRDKQQSFTKALLVGDVDYSTPIVSSMKGNDVYAYQYFVHKKDHFKYLQFTEEEVVNIYAIRGNSHHDGLLLGSSASDEAFMAQAPGYNILHLATHGFFTGTLKSGTDTKPILTDNCLSESGVLFAGYKPALRDLERDHCVSDGILTAKEIATADFSNVSLVVLSACQSGIGHFTDDGVYGMQRGLKMAGAHALMLSLWCVSDRAASELMTNFYNELEICHNITTAFCKAKRQLSEKSGFSTPRDTNAFILIDAM